MLASSVFRKTCSPGGDPQMFIDGREVRFMGKIKVWEEVNEVKKDFGYEFSGFCGFFDQSLSFGV